MRVIGPYELLVRLSSANTGYVYSARRDGAPLASSLVAIKLIKPKLAAEVRYGQLLLTEATAAMTFSHRNTVRFLDITQNDGQIAHVMELVRGQPLSAVVERAHAMKRPFSRNLILWSASWIARALATAHMTPWCDEDERGMVHAEVSPQSILVGYDGTVKLLGVGVGRSRLVLPPARTRLPYRAPELFERRRAETSTDVYGLGAVLFDLLARTRLYAREGVNETIQAILDARHAPLSSFAPELDPQVTGLVDSMLARAPEKRPTAMAEIAEALERAASLSSNVAQSTLAEEMRVLFAREMQESVIEAPSPDRAPIRTAHTPGMFDPNAPLEPSQISEIVPNDAYDRFDVDALVDAIVGTRGRSSKIEAPPKPIPTPPKPLEAPPIPEKSGEKYTPPPVLISSTSSARIDSPSPRVEKPKKGNAFSRALDEASTEGEIDALVEAIVHASAQAKTDPQIDYSKPVEPQRFTTGDLGSETFGFNMGHVINGRYRVIEKLGSGGMAIVYKVEHTHLEKNMALKLLRPELSTVPYVVQRFQREARFVSQLDDPRIVRVTDFGRAENGSLFLVMELIDGETLSRRLDRVGALPLPIALHIAEQMLLALDHAHRQNVIHRDLKPDNIMLLEKEGRAQVKIVDFGIAKLAGEAPSTGRPLTQAGMVFGSPRYMSPEQAAGEAVDHRSDIYAVGVMLYEMLCGKRPFDGTSARAILSAVLVQPPPPLVLQLDDAERARAIEAVVMRAMSKDREARYPSAMAFWESLRANM
jgi:serine/threonine protein kinase